MTPCQSWIIFFFLHLVEKVEANQVGLEDDLLSSTCSQDEEWEKLLLDHQENTETRDEHQGEGTTMHQ